MMTIKQYFLNKLAEECVEVAQRAIKQMQFGKDETQASGPSLNKTGAAAETNDARLQGEIIDFLTVMHVLIELGEVPAIDLAGVAAIRMIEKRQKLAKYLKWSQDCGQVIIDPNFDVANLRRFDSHALYEDFNHPAPVKEECHAMYGADDICGLPPDSPIHTTSPRRHDFVPKEN